jgi:hypothetical protein
LPAAKSSEADPGMQSGVEKSRAIELRPHPIIVAAGLPSPD